MPTLTALEADRDLLAKRLVTARTAALELLGVHLGRRLGLYDVLARTTDVSAEELAAGAGIAVRSATEWLEQQAVAGFLTVIESEEAGRRFLLPAGHREVLIGPESPFPADDDDDVAAWLRWLRPDH